MRHSRPARPFDAPPCPSRRTPPGSPPRSESAQYTSAAFAQVCGRFGVRRSMGRVGSSYDNALAESLWQSLKREAIYKMVFSTMSQARLQIFRWLTYYNTRRRHRSLSYLSPTEFEQQHHKGAKLLLAA